jgi:hypothetical protein
MNGSKLSIPTRAAVSCIRFYQRYFSPDHSLWAKAMDRPPYCKHVPSCSEYAVEAFEKKGFAKGLFKAVWRVLRCNPWSRGGYDPVDSLPSPNGSSKK